MNHGDNHFKKHKLDIKKRVPCAHTGQLKHIFLALAHTTSNFCPQNFRVLNGECLPCAVGEHTPGGDDLSISETTCCASDEYEKQPPTKDAGGGADRICKKCFGNNPDTDDVDKYFSTLKCCGKGEDATCRRVYDGFNKACANHASSTCSTFEKYGTLGTGADCTHNNQCDNGNCDIGNTDKCL